MSDNRSFFEPRILGRSGLRVGALGFGSSYGGSARAYEAAFEKGFNYFYWGTYRRGSMGEAIRNLAKQQREQMVVALQSYSRTGLLLNWSIKRGLKQLKLDYADVLLLGWHNKAPSSRVWDAALQLKEKGLIRKIAISCHDRPRFQEYISDPRVDVIMVRYNAAHRGAEREVFPFLPTNKDARPGVITYTATRWGCLNDPKYTPAGIATPTAADCYRFALTNPNVDLVLSGPSSDAEMQENLAGLTKGPMSPDEIAWMKQVGDHVHKLTAKRVTNPFMQRRQ